MALSADGRFVAGGGLDAMLRVWDATTGESLVTLRATRDIHAMTLSADGHLLISGGSDGIVRIWEATTGTLLRTLQGERPYEGLDVTGLTGVTDAQRTALRALGAVEQVPARTSTN